MNPGRAISCIEHTGQQIVERIGRLQIAQAGRIR